MKEQKSIDNESLGNKSKKLKKHHKIQTTTSQIFNMKNILIIGIISLLVVIVYQPSSHNGFVYDDVLYIEKNPLLTDLSFQGISNIFSKYVAGNYHPVTILSLAIDYHLFKGNPTGYHIMNIILHCLVTASVFFFTLKISKNLIGAIITSLLFGIHPLHVESVAWISGRKDLIFVLFFIISTLLYLYYSETKTKKLYYLTLLFFCFSCLSKAIAVVLPVIFFILDYYHGVKVSKRMLLEKIPFIIISIIIGLIAIDAQKDVGALKEITQYTNSFSDKLFYACYGLFFYLYKFIIPINMSAIYPYPDKIDGSLPIIFLITPFIILIIIGLLIYFRKKSKVPIFSFLFYFVSILPVLQLLPVGSAITADRYFYLSSIGLFFMIGIGFSFIYNKFTIKKGYSQYINTSLITIAIIVAVIFSVVSYQRTQIWVDNMSLYSDVILKEPNAAGGYFGLGQALRENKSYDKAIQMYNKTIEINPKHSEAYFNMGNVYLEVKKYNKAVESYLKTIELNPGHLKVNTNLGSAYFSLQEYDKAAQAFQKAIEINPRDMYACNNLGYCYYKQKDFAKAIEMFNKAIEIEPNYRQAYMNIATVYNDMGKTETALEYLSKANKIK